MSKNILTGSMNEVTKAELVAEFKAVIADAEALTRQQRWGLASRSWSRCGSSTEKCIFMYFKTFKTLEADA